MAKHAHIPGMINPYKMGLLGGISGFLQGFSQHQAAQDKFAQQSAIEEMKAKNNRLMKMLEVDANQRAYTVHQVGDDGKVYDVSMRNVYNSQTGKYEPTELSRAPSKDPMAATNALISSREKTSKDNIDAANKRNAERIAAENQRNKDRIAGRNDPSAETAAERRNRVQQDALNHRAALHDANTDMREYNKADSETRAQMLKDAGVKVDPAKDPAAAKKAYHDAVLAQHQEDYATGDTSAPPQPGESTAHPDKTPKGQPIKYDAQGQAYIKGPDGKPVPYTPSADADNAGASGLALDSPEAQQLAMDHPSMTGEAAQDDEAAAPDTSAMDQQDESLIAQQQNAPQDNEQQEPAPDDEGQEQYGGILA